MGQVLHGCAATTKAIRRAIQHSQASLRQLARRYGINPKMARKWRARSSVVDLRTGPKEPRSTILSIDEEAVVIAFHRCLQRHGIIRLPPGEGDKPTRKTFKPYPIGYFHIDIAEVQGAEGKPYLYVAVGRPNLGRRLPRGSDRSPYKIRIVLTDNSIQFTFPPCYADGRRHATSPACPTYVASKTASSTASPRRSIPEPTARSNA